MAPFSQEVEQSPIRGDSRRQVPAPWIGFGQELGKQSDDLTSDFTICDIQD